MKLYQVDAFTKEFFRGNPAGVCILPGNVMPHDRLLQNIAMEMNLSETAFFVKENGEYTLRWFTPEAEIDFCGHATLATAHILWETGREGTEKELLFNTKTGRLSAKKVGDRIELNFPAIEVREVPSDEAINRALGIIPLFTGTDGKRHLIEISGYDELARITPDFNALRSCGKTLFMVTCGSEKPEYDFYSRFFAPMVGINEDPVTGSAHSYLAPYWSKKLNKRVMRSYQASRRGGEMECEMTGDNRVLLRGNAVTVFEIEMKAGTP